jgi:hypothetical protein
MRNDARPIGEQFRDIAEHDRPGEEEQEHRGSPPSAPGGRRRDANTPFVVNRNPGDEEAPPDSSDR